MARFGIIAVLIGLLLADPVLCRSAEADNPCHGVCGSMLGLEHGQQPSNGCHDTGHGCLCQGATNDRHSGQLAELELPARAVPWLRLPWPDFFAIIVRFPSDFSPLGDAHGLPIGRSLRILHQSFQI